MSDLVPRVEVYAFGPREWRYRLVTAEGVTESGPLPGVRGTAGVALRDAYLAYPRVPIVVDEGDA